LPLGAHKVSATLDVAIRANRPDKPSPAGGKRNKKREAMASLFLFYVARLLATLVGDMPS
ncbi:MAG: hypothetical protein ACRC4P_07055, partial [Aeromonas sp.]